MENPREMMMEVEAEVSRGHNGEITANPPTEEEEASKREQLEEVRKRDKERLRDLRKQQKDALQEARSQQNQVVEAQEVSFLDLLDYPGEGGG
jgi:membrane protein involved in colicin uptake